MKAVIMAGGFGVRLHPLTFGCPKVMVTFVNKPALAHVIDLLRQHGFTEVIITVQYMADQIQAYFGNGQAFGITIHYAVEKSRLGSAGGVKNAQSFLSDEPFLVISGDIITDIDLQKVVAYHQSKKALATLALIEIADPRPYGVVTTATDGRVQSYVEKPHQAPQTPCHISTGLYVLEPKVLDYMQPYVVYDFAYDIFPKLIADKVPFFGYTAEGYWCDIGSGIPQYKQATADALTSKIKNLNLGNQINTTIWCGQNVQVDLSAMLNGPIYLGDEVVIKAGAVIQGPTIIGSHTLIDQKAVVEQSIIGRNCYVSESAHMKNVIIPNGVG